MNERIRELIDDAKLTAVSEMFEDDLQKFAQLIVRECMKLNSKELSITAIERLLPLYEEHFGVRE